jgi:PAS domain S-box-containing protein
MSAEDTASGVGSDPPPTGDVDVSGALFRQITDRSPVVAMVVAAPNFEIVYANSAAHRATGRKAGDLVGRSAAAAFSFIDPSLLTPEPESETHDRSVAVTGTEGTRWWDVSYIALDRSAGGAAAILITAVDVTHHEVFRAGAVRDSEERLRAVLLQIPAATYILEAPDSRITFKSRLLDEVLGYPDENLPQAKALLRGWAVHDDGSPYEIEEYPSRRALFNGETVQAEPMAFVRGDGRLINLDVHAGPVRSETGEIVAAVVVAMDVTERRQAEARQTFLYNLQDALRALTEPSEILSTAARLLGRHLGAGRIGFSEMQPDGDTLLVTNGYVDGASPVDGLFSLKMFGPHHETEMRQGRTLVYDDVQADERGAREFGLQLGTRAHVSVPRIRDGRYSGSFYVTHFKPYRWTPSDIRLIEEVAERIWDAAERGRAEARLRESEERLRLVMEASGLGFWEYDAKTKKTVRSARHDEIFGYPAPVSDWSYEHFNAHVPDPDRGKVEQGFRAALERGEDWDIECRMVRADGSPGWLRVKARPHCGADGQVARLLGTVADITARKQAENTAIETAARFETFAQTMPSMVWVSSPDGEMEWFNARVSEYCGVPEDDMKPDGWSPVHPDDVEEATRRWREALVTGQSYEIEYRIRRHDGMFRWHITRAIPIRSADGDIMRWIGTSADIEDQKRSEQALADLNATLEEQVRARTAELLAAEATLRQSQKMEAVGQLTGGLAHDFNNLLTGITGSLELMQTRLDQGKLNELGRYLHIAQVSAQRAAALTHRLLAFSRRQTLDPKPTALNQLVFGMDELIRGSLGPAVKLELDTAPELWAVLVDPNQLENALLNLCINARDAMPDGGRVRIETRNRTLEASEAMGLELSAGEYVELRVADTGCGMTPEVVARAFDPFFTTKPIGEGTGLGLSMVYGFARQSGGQIAIHSEPGRGTQVCLYLPRRLGGVGPGEVMAGSTRLQRGGGETVLVVDDEPSVRLLVNEVLHEMGYNVLEAETGAAGLRILESDLTVDLLVTDVGLPGGMNGRQLADAARVRRPDLKILFITGYAENAVVGQGNLAPGMHILTKPFSLETLGARIAEMASISSNI